MAGAIFVIVNLILLALLIRALVRSIKKSRRSKTPPASTTYDQAATALILFGRGKRKR